MLSGNSNSRLSSVSMRVLIEALRAWSAPNYSLSFQPQSIDWGEAIHLATTSNTVFAMLDGLQKHGIQPPAQIAEKAAAERRAILASNLACIAATVRIGKILRSHGIESTAMKGVTRMHSLFGRWDMRRAGDVDVLVTRKNYHEAIEVLTSNKFIALVPAKSRWWHDFLGESPYLSPHNDGVIIDLHYKLDQPGTPADADVEALIHNSRLVNFGKSAAYVLSDKDSLMLAATSFGKAIRSKEPWLRHAHEIAIARSGARSEADNGAASEQLYDRYAASKGISRLWRHAKEASDMLFKENTDLSPDVFEETVRSSIGRQGDGRHNFVRSQLLWRWTDGVFSRPLQFASELYRVRRSEARHDYEEQLE